MKKEKLFNILVIAFGIVSVLLFVFIFVFLGRVYPKMVAFAELTTLENDLLTVVGFSLLVIMCFCLLSLLQIVRYIRYAEKVNFLSILLLVSGILTMLFIFADVALLNDIVKQYKNEMTQPEWSMLFPVMGAQAAIILVFLILHLAGLFSKKQLTQITKDNNIFFVVQYVGIICGGMGMAASSLGFFFPKAWDAFMHTVISMVILSLPYALAVFYWLTIKIREKDRQFYDEKQRLDIGRSSFVTLILATTTMVVLFAVNIKQLDGVLSMLWLPLLFFGEIFIFSLGNLYYSNKS